MNKRTEKMNKRKK